MLFCCQSSILLTRPGFVPTVHRFIELRSTDLAALHQQVFTVEVAVHVDGPDARRIGLSASPRRTRPPDEFLSRDDSLPSQNAVELVRCQIFQRFICSRTIAPGEVS